MKSISFRILITVLAILVHHTSFAQIEEIAPTKTSWITIGEVKWLANTKGSLKYTANKTDTVYLLYLQDATKLKDNNDRTVYKYFSLSFKETGNTLNHLYELLISFFNPENKKDKDYEKTFRLGNDLVMIRHYPALLSPSIALVAKDSYIVLNEKEVHKLFGR